MEIEHLKGKIHLENVESNDAAIPNDIINTELLNMKTYVACPAKTK